MKRLLSVLLVVLLTGTTIAQNPSFTAYDTHSKWFFGLNYGGTWHSADVRNNFGFGGQGAGFVLGRSYGYNYGSPVSFDLRGRFLGGTWRGMDRKLTFVSPGDNVLNGTNNSSIDYYTQDSSVLRNFRNGQAEFNLELVLHLNRLRENTGWDVYAFGGIGATFWQSKGNYLNTINGDNFMYDYSNLNNDFSQANLDEFFDGTQETKHKGSSSVNVNWMPHLGIGVGYQIGPRVTFGLEHKTTFARNDVWDGLDYGNNGQATGQNDLYHYTNLYLRWYLREGRRRPVRPQPPVSNVPPCNYPTLSFSNPMQSHQTLAMQSFNVSANIRNVNNRNQITMRVNGQFNSNFTYNMNSGILQSQLFLSPGQNLVEITVTNNCGSVTDSRIIVFQQDQFPNNPPTQLPPPFVSISNPAFSPHTVQESSFNLQAQVLNVSGRQNIQMTVNGMAYSNFNYSNQSNQLTANLNLVEGNNTIVITASNQVGTDSKQTVIIYNRPQHLPPPVVQFNTPTNSSLQVTQPQAQINANVFHVTNKNSITVTVNGQALSSGQFTFNSNTSVVTFNTQLVPGANTIQISGVNVVGSDSKFITLIYQQMTPQLPPVVTFTNPSVSPFNTFEASHQVSAIVQHVQNASQIQVWVNNAAVSNFTFNNTSNQVQFVTGLQQGSNIVRIKGTNNAGFDEETVTIIYTPHNPVLPPVVTITQPMGNPATVTESTVNVNATVLNLEYANQIEVKVNNQNINNFNFNAATHQVTFIASLNQGTNSVLVKGTNSAGTAQDTKNIIYKKVVELLPPTVSFVNPAATPTTVNNAAYNMVAAVTNVANQSEIQVQMNGVNVPSNLWSFDLNNMTVSMSTALILGNNSFTVTATNTAGSDSKTAVVKYEEPVVPCLAPSVTLISPASMNNTVETANVSFSADVTNITAASQVTVFLNGSAIQGWSLNASNNKVTGSFTLSQGNNVAEILVQNECGKQRITFLYVYQTSATCNAPVITAISPNSTLQTQENNISVSAATQHIADASEVTFYVNGAETVFNFDPASQVLTANASLVLGTNVLRFESVNNCGKGTAQWTVQKVACENPVLNLSSSVQSGTTVNTNEINISGTILNVVNSQAISVTKNGTPISFIYQSNNESFNCNATLVVGMNTIVVTATNACGSNSYTVNVTYQAPIIPTPPVVSITNPEVSPFNTQQANMSVAAEVLNVTSQSQIQVTVNGNNKLFVFNPATHLVIFDQTWIEGNNTIVVSAQNPDGQASDSKVVVYTKPAAVKRPMVVFTSPLEQILPTEATNFTFTGYIVHLQSVSQASGMLNGQPITNINAQMIDNQVHFSVPVTFDNNHSEFILQIVGQNSAGSHTQSREVHHEAASVDDPINCIPVVGAVFANDHKSVSVSSTKDLSNVVLKFHDNTTQKFENLSGTSGTFQGTAGNDKKCIIGVWIKSGCNQSNDGPGYGEWKPNNSYSGTCSMQQTCGVNIKQGTAAWQFCMETSAGTYNTSTLNGNSTFTYEGSASSVFFVPQNNGEVFVNGTPYQVLANNYYLFQGNNEVIVDKKNGNWNICLNASATPTFGLQNGPTSPCEPAPGGSVNTDTDTTNAQIGNNDGNCLPTITNSYSNGMKTVTITSDMNLNNVVLKFHDNTTQQFNNLFGKTRTLSGTGANNGKCIIGVWVKSGCNSSEDGPNYGAYFPNNGYNDECAATTPEACGPLFSLRTASWEFCMITPSGTVNRDVLANNAGYTYSGAASSVYFYAQNNGSVTVNGQPYAIVANNYYSFNGSIQVSVTKNNPAAPGQWMICITTNSAPLSGGINTRPPSPCEEASDAGGRINNPAPSTRPNTRPSTTSPNTRPNNPKQNDGGTQSTKPSSQKPKPVEEKPVKPSSEQAKPQQEVAPKPGTGGNRTRPK